MAIFNLENKVALVSGASRGIGESIAMAYAEQGAKVVLVSRRQEGLDEVAQRISQAGGQALPLACHIGKPEEIAQIFVRLRSEFGRLDVLVNNAATNPYFGPMVHAPESAFDKTFEVNVKGYFLMSQRAGQMMVEQNAGCIINVASIEGISPSPMMGIYSMTKAAVIMMTKAFARELGGSNVRCNCICPGLTETKFAKVLIDTPEIYDHYIQGTALARHAQPEEVAGAAVYLASDAAQYVTGAVLAVDGGYSV